jgi:predicted DNA-binding transcriptional regulator AlpA
MTDHYRSPMPCVQILRLPQACKVTGLGRSMIYQLESEHRFPCRVRLGARAVGWVEAEVQSWLARRVEHYRVGEPSNRP